MNSVTVLWNSEHRSELENLLKREGESREEFILEITENAILSCSLEELATLIHDLLSIEKFDVVELSNFSAVAVLYRLKKRGLPNLLVRPSPFSRKKLDISPVGRGRASQAIVKRQRGSPTKRIMLSALVFFIIVVLGLVFYRVTRGRRRSIR